MALLVAFGVLMILAGMTLVRCTDRVERYWAKRRMPVRPSILSPPPFIWSERQCVDCGRDDELLNLDKRCIFCFHKAWADG